MENPPDRDQIKTLLGLTDPKEIKALFQAARNDSRKKAGAVNLTSFGTKSFTGSCPGAGPLSPKASIPC